MSTVKKIKFRYNDSMDLRNALETLAEALPEFGVTLEVLDGGDGFEEVQITKKDSTRNGQS